MHPDFAADPTVRCPAASTVWYGPARKLVRTAELFLLASLVLASTALAQSPGTAWELERTDGRFEGAHGTVQLEAVRGSGTAELMLGCTTADPTLPTLILSGDSDFGNGPRNVYARVLGLKTTSENSWHADGSELVLSGFDAALLLSDLAGTRSSRPFFLRVEGDESMSWGVPFTGFHEVLKELSCTTSFN